MTALRRLALLLCFCAVLPAQPPEPSPKLQFIEVEPGVRLEVLDWGGRGRPLVLLPGLGETAHIYDALARKLTDRNHVYGITRRGFGASSVPRSGYTARRLADDVLHVLDALKLEKPVLAGHSVAGEELSSIGARRSDRIAGLIYLDAASDRTWVRPTEPEKPGKQGAFTEMGIPEQPKPVPGHFDPADEVRAGVEKPQYSLIRVPALALYAAPRTWSELMPESEEISDPKKKAAAEQVVATMARVRTQMAESFRAGVANSHVVEIPGASHYLFQTHEADVLREMRKFLDRLN